MPDKIAQKIETNGHAVPEQPPEKVQETTQRYTREAGKATQDAMRVYGDLVSTTTNYYVNALGKTIRYSIDLAAHTERSIGETMGIYRRAYSDGVKAWQIYWQDINKVFARPK